MTQWLVGVTATLWTIDRVTVLIGKVQAKRNGGTELDVLHRIELRLAELPAKIKQELQ